MTSKYHANTMIIALSGRVARGHFVVAQCLRREIGLRRHSMDEPIFDSIAEMTGERKQDLMATGLGKTIELLDMSPRECVVSMRSKWAPGSTYIDTLVGCAMRAIQEAQDDMCPGLIITDVSTEQEAEALRARGAIIIHAISSPGERPMVPPRTDLGDVIAGFDGSTPSLINSIKRILRGH